ncbi:unnamed protein product [Musa acuminata subsp. burmannicoides]
MKLIQRFRSLASIFVDLYKFSYVEKINLIAEKQKQQSKSDLNTQPDRSAPLSRPRVRRFHGCSTESWNLEGIVSGLRFLVRLRPASTPPHNSSSLFSTLSVLPSSFPTSLLRMRPESKAPSPKTAMAANTKRSRPSQRPEESIG